MPTTAEPLPPTEERASSGPDLIVRVADAKARLSELIQRAERGDRVVIARGDTPVIELVPLPRAKRAFGTLLARVPGLDLVAVHAVAEDDWTEGELEAFEGDLENELR
ncbi:type II toxin-antitoxin system Phd/YefM family antitoxin [Parvularcula dongshanensis]|uniref:Prevent-host-death family protein n=1 Tax=Parvularcula dongshanensis TaxID=1173995 RepID=A0A840I7P3_9PROT|nr:type II toxin-antitoxin system prevent-host-death family antitoxin [Parvularcula dongshanensis]MBB4660283.1 prevent-host-death family protein [Parvularcula dongshanensis]